MLNIIKKIITNYPEYREFELEIHNGSASFQSVFHLHWPSPFQRIVQNLLKPLK